jgi:hypothetical protein
MPNARNCFSDSRRNTSCSDNPILISGIFCKSNALAFFVIVKFWCFNEKGIIS